MVIGSDGGGDGDDGDDDLMILVPMSWLIFARILRRLGQARRFAALGRATREGNGNHYGPSSDVVAVRTVHAWGSGRRTSACDVPSHLPLHHIMSMHRHPPIVIRHHHTPVCIMRRAWLNVHG